MSKSPRSSKQVGERHVVKFEKETRTKLHRFYRSGKNLGFYSKDKEKILKAFNHESDHLIWSF